MTNYEIKRRLCTVKLRSNININLLESNIVSLFTHKHVYFCASQRYANPGQYHAQLFDFKWT